MSLFFVEDGRHVSNIKMRELFGDYKDIASIVDSTSSSSVNDIVASLKSGKECMIKVNVKSIKQPSQQQGTIIIINTITIIIIIIITIIIRYNERKGVTRSSEWSKGSV